MLRVRAPGSRASSTFPWKKCVPAITADTYFNRAREIMRARPASPAGADAGLPTRPLRAVRHRRSARDRANCAAVRTKRAAMAGSDGWNDARRCARLHDGDEIAPFETVMTIEGDYTLFAHLETAYLGASSRGGRASRPMRARSSRRPTAKEVLFFPARFDHHQMQTGRRVRRLYLGRPRRLDRCQCRVVGFARHGYGAARVDRRVRRRHRARDAEVCRNTSIRTCT